MLLYVVGRVNYWKPREWEFCGIFQSQKKAEEMCETIAYFVGPIELDREIDIKVETWPNAYYPKKEKCDNGRTSKC